MANHRFVVPSLSRPPSPLQSTRHQPQPESLESFVSFEVIQQEACQVFVVGLELFYQSYLEQSKFVLEVLNSVEEQSLETKIHYLPSQFNSNKATINKTTSPSNFSSRPNLPTTSSSVGTGRKLLLQTLLNLFANHANPSYLILPPDQPSPVTAASGRVGILDMDVIFIPIIRHLLDEAQRSLDKRLAENGPSLFAPSLYSSPPVHLLMNIQKVRN